MPNTPEPQPEPATDRCPPRYATRRQARRGAYWLATRRSERPADPVFHEHCGGYHLATDMTTTTTGA